jgi:hypothetical protein
MAKNTVIENGTKVKFLGYEEGDEGELSKGAMVTIVGYDATDKTYDVEDAEGNGDSLYAEEFEVGDAVETAPATKSAAAPKNKAKAAAKPVDAKAEKAKENAAAIKAKEKEAAAKAKAKAVADKAAAKAAEEQALLDAMPKFKKTTSVAAALKEFDGDAIAAANALAEQKEQTVFTLGGVLAFVKRNNLQATIPGEEDAEGNATAAYTADLKGFDAYAEDTLGIGKRSANYYVQLYERFSQLTTEAKLARIGWTKLRELLRLNNLLDEGSVEEWLEVARTNSTTAVKEKVTTAIVDAGDEVETHGNTSTADATSWKLLTYNDQTDMVRAAFAMAREVLGDDASDSKCFVHIVQEWTDLGYEGEGEAEEEAA